MPVYSPRLFFFLRLMGAVIVLNWQDGAIKSNPAISEEGTGKTSNLRQDAGSKQAQATSSVSKLGDAKDSDGDEELIAEPGGVGGDGASGGVGPPPRAPAQVVRRREVKHQYRGSDDGPADDVDPFAKQVCAGNRDLYTRVTAVWSWWVGWGEDGIWLGEGRLETYCAANID